MPAIITDKFKKQLLTSTLEDIADSDNNYYIGIGRSEIWDSADVAPPAYNSEREVRNFRLSMQSIKNVTDYSFVAIRSNWSSGAIYSGYDDNVEGTPNQNFYVITDENHVYVCVRQGRNNAGQRATSTVKPTGTSNVAFETADGYVWKFLYSIGALTASKFLAANYIPVKIQGPVDSDSPASDIEQKGIQDNAVDGEILAFEMIDQGSGYTLTPSVVIHGNGSGASATASISGGAVTKVEIDVVSDELQFGSGYTYAHVEFTGGNGTGAVARAIIGPSGGLGADPRNDIKARGIMFNAKPDGSETGDFVINNDFRQVGLIKNPKISATDSDFSGSTANTLKRLEFSSVGTPFTVDKTILGGSSQARAYIDKVDSDTVWFHQTEKTGFIPFQEGESVTETNGSGVGVLNSTGADGDNDAFEAPEVNPFSGDVFYIDNRAAITRSDDQAEDIKIIIQI